MGFTDNNIAPILGQSLSFLTFIDLKFGSWIDLNIDEWKQKLATLNYWSTLYEDVCTVNIHEQE